MADVSRFPQGLILGGVAAAAPVGAIQQNAAGALVRSTNAAAAAFAALNGFMPAALVADPGDGVAIPVNQSAHISLTVGAGAETNTLAIPAFQGQIMSIELGVVGAGTRAITAASVINVANQTQMTFAAALDRIVLIGTPVGATLFWYVLVNDGVALA